MKKTFLLIAFAVATFSMTSCKSEPKTETTTETPMEATSEEIAYACPMDCEKGKTYTEMGKCPVCEMDLVASNTPAAESHEGHDHDSHEGHDH
jgi:hypothetical protein